MTVCRFGVQLEEEELLAVAIERLPRLSVGRVTDIREAVATFELAVKRTAAVIAEAGGRLKPEALALWAVVARVANRTVAQQVAEEGAPVARHTQHLANSDA